jgi:hypothetical protein
MNTLPSRNGLVFTLFVGPVIAAVDLAAGYMLVYRAQTQGSNISLHVTAVVALVITLASAAWAGNVLRRRDTLLPVDRLLAEMSFGLSLFFALLVIAYAIPTFVLHATD